MKVESCRKCGRELKIHKKCEICKKPNEFICKNCGIVKNEQLHLKCIMIHMDYKLLKASQNKTRKKTEKNGQKMRIKLKKIARRSGKSVKREGKVSKSKTRKKFTISQKRTATVKKSRY